MISASQKHNSTTLLIFFEILDNTNIGRQKKLQLIREIGSISDDRPLT